MPTTHDIRARRLALGLSQAALGQHIGLSQVWVSHAELHPREYPDVVRRLDELLATLDGSEARRLAWLEEERQRCARQEALFGEALQVLDYADTFGDVGDIAGRLKAAMLARCLELMHQGDGEACDAIAEWLPAADVAAMFAQWEAESTADHKCAGCQPRPFAMPEHPESMGPTEITRDPDGATDDPGR